MATYIIYVAEDFTGPYWIARTQEGKFIEGTLSRISKDDCCRRLAVANSANAVEREVERVEL